MSKIVCGIDIEGSTANLVTLSGDRESSDFVGIKFKKIGIKDHKNQDEIQTFRQALLSHLENEGVSVIGIKTRSTKGEFSAGPISFKLEGIIQTLNVPVQFVHPATIKATMKKYNIDLEELGIYKYQHEAYKVAFHLLGA